MCATWETNEHKCSNCMAPFPCFPKHSFCSSIYNSIYGSVYNSICGIATIACVVASMVVSPLD